ncbi:MAG TPA: cytoplasmic protein [Syntrophobacteraceae bacterium]|nr:cytoplasmic protein [Syntrophobacteraceae bacterium]
MSKHRHTFVETYDGLIAFGMSRDVDEKSLTCYLQKFSDDELLKVLVPRLSDEEINGIFEMLSQTLRNHLADREYHALFLKD